MNKYTKQWFRALGSFRKWD